MVSVEVKYLGDLRTEVIHGPSGQTITTDAPVDNHGRGGFFSPTDMVAGALAACVATLMGIYAQKHGLDIAGARVSVEKHMITEPRRIGRLPVTVDMPIDLDARHRTAIEATARHCPVHSSLHPDIDSPIVFRYPAAR
jgi:putative redox protein